MTELTGLKSALGFSVNLIATEHFFSAGLSSPWSTQKFAKTPEDRAMVERLFHENAVASVISSVIVGLLLQDWTAFLFSIAGSAVVIVFVKSQYDRAFAGAL